MLITVIGLVIVLLSVPVTGSVLVSSDRVSSSVGVGGSISASVSDGV